MWVQWKFKLLVSVRSILLVQGRACATKWASTWNGNSQSILKLYISHPSVIIKQKTKSGEGLVTQLVAVFVSPSDFWRSQKGMHQKLSRCLKKQLKWGCKDIYVRTITDHVPLLHASKFSAILARMRTQHFVDGYCMAWLQTYLRKNLGPIFARKALGWGSGPWRCFWWECACGTSTIRARWDAP